MALDTGITTQEGTAFPKVTAPIYTLEGMAEEPTNVSVGDAKSKLSGETNYEESVRLYGNPLAVDSLWSVRPEDENLTQLPEIGEEILKQLKYEVKEGVLKRLPGFLRDPTINTSFNYGHKFEPLVIPSKTSTSMYMADGFKTHYAGDVFVKHDVSPADWFQFLADIASSKKLGFGSGIIAGGARLASRIPVPIIPAVELIEEYLKNGNDNTVQDTVKVWRKGFFNPRGLDVYIEEAKSPVGTPRAEESNLAIEEAAVDDSQPSEETHNQRSRRSSSFLNARWEPTGRYHLVVAPLFKASAH